MGLPIKISIIAPVYGVETYIAEFARSVLGQTYSHIQYIFVNDGTKDNSMRILKDILDEYPHRTGQVVIVEKENGGLPAARATGLEYVSGDYVYHVDSDDWLSPNAIEKIVLQIEKTGSDIVYFNFVKEYRNAPKNKRERRYAVETKNRYIHDMCNHKAFGYVWNKCVKHSLYTSSGICIPKNGYAEDFFLMSQLLGRANSISYLDEYLYHYRRDNPNALTRQNRKKRKREYAENALEIYKYYNDKPLSENPVACIMDHLAIQAGWFSVCYNLGLFKEYSFLAKVVRKAKLSLCSDVPVLAQLYVKIVALFK